MTILKTMKGIISKTVKINSILIIYVERRPQACDYKNKGDNACGKLREK